MSAGSVFTFPVDFIDAMMRPRWLELIRCNTTLDCYIYEGDLILGKTEACKEWPLNKGWNQGSDHTPNSNPARVKVMQVNPDHDLSRDPTWRHA